NVNLTDATLHRSLLLAPIMMRSNLLAGSSRFSQRLADIPEEGVPSYSRREWLAESGGQKECYTNLDMQRGLTAIPNSGFIMQWNDTGHLHCRGDVAKESAL